MYRNQILKTKLKLKKLYYSLYFETPLTLINFGLSLQINCRNKRLREGVKRKSFVFFF